VTVALYWLEISHPSQAARAMLDLKALDYELKTLVPLAHRAQLHLAGFRGGTVPALKLDGRRIQGSRAIARALDERWPEPPLFPADPVARRQAEAAERWGDEQFQPVPRRLFRYAMRHHAHVRRWGARVAGFPAPDLVAAAMPPVVAGFARTVESDGRRASAGGVRADLAALPALLAEADRLLAAGTLALDPPGAATLQILSTVHTLEAFADLKARVAAHACAAPARQLFPPAPGEVPPFLPAEWLEPLRAPTPV
jgi:glutathione S-transferase